MSSATHAHCPRPGAPGAASCLMVSRALDPSPRRRGGAAVQTMPDERLSIASAPGRSPAAADLPLGFNFASVPVHADPAAARAPAAIFPGRRARPSAPHQQPG